MLKTLTTDSVHEKDRGDYWNDMITQSFVSLDFDPVCNRNKFSGHITNCPLGAAQISHVVASSQHVKRRQNMLRSHDDDSFLLSFQLSGSGQVVQDDRSTTLRPGQYALYATHKPYELKFDKQFAQIVLKVPRACFLKFVPFGDQIVSQQAPDDLWSSRLVSNHLANLADELQNGQEIDSPRILNSTLELLGEAYTIVAETRKNLPSSQEASLLRVKQFIIENLTDPEFSIKHIVDQFGISDRYVRKLFAATDISPSRWIWGKRTERCHEQLSSPIYNHLSISEIAFACGFNDMGHFSRSFKAKYGFSPRQYRKGLNIH